VENLKKPEKVSQMAQWQKSSQVIWNARMQGYEKIMYY